MVNLSEILQPYDFSPVLDSQEVWIRYAKEIFLWYTVNIALAVAGSVLFLLLIMVSITTRRFRSGSGILILHLLVTEFLMCSVFALGFTVTVYVPEFRFDSAQCRHFLSAMMITIGAGQWSNAFLAVNRTVAISFPLYYEKLLVRKIMLLKIFLAWMIPFISNLPIYTDNGGRYDISPTFFTCSVRPSPVGPQWGLNLMVWFSVYIPMVCTVGFYLFLLAQFVWHKHRLGQTKGVKVISPAVLKRKFAVTKMLIVSCLWYMICYFPNGIVLVNYPEVFKVHPPLQLWLRALYFAGYVGNPVIFFVMCEDYRNGMRQLCDKLKNLRQGRRVNQDTLSRSAEAAQNR